MQGRNLFNEVALQTLQQSKVQQPENLLIWIDPNIMSSENQKYDKEFKELYKTRYQSYGEMNKALEVIRKNIPHMNFIIVCNSSIGYQIVKEPNIFKIIIFCGDKRKHSQLFLQNKQIQQIVDFSFDDVKIEVEYAMQYFKSTYELNQIFNPSSLESQQYQHSEKFLNLQFLLLIEEYRKESEVTFDQVFHDIDAILPPQKKFQRLNMVKALQEKQEQYQKELNPFEVLIYFYSRNEIYSNFNLQYASNNYQIIKNLFVCLLQGFKSEMKKQKQTIKKQQIKTLYRGTALSQQYYNDVLSSLEKSRKHRTSIFWNTPTSTSQKKDVALNFAQVKEKVGIVYKIYLNQGDPHPHFFLDSSISWQLNESEVLLFPQFQFQVEKINVNKKKKKSIDNMKYTKVTIKQADNSFSQLFHNHKKHNFWLTKIQDLITPNLDCLTKCQQRRLQQIINDEKLFIGFSEAEKERVKQEEFKYYETQITTQLKILMPFQNFMSFYSINQPIMLNNSDEQLQQIRSDILSSSIQNIKSHFDIHDSQIKAENIQQKLKIFFELLEKNPNFRLAESYTPKRLLFFLSYLLGITAYFTFLVLSIYPFFKFLYRELKRIEKSNATPEGKFHQKETLIRQTFMSIGLMLLSHHLLISNQQLRCLLSMQKSANSVCLYLQVELRKKNFREMKNNHLNDPGVNPRCYWELVNASVKSFILYAIEKGNIIWLVPNISSDKRMIEEDCGKGLKLVNNYPYYGPISLDSVTFRILGIAEENIDENNALYLLENSKITVIQQSIFHQQI